ENMKIRMAVHVIVLLKLTFPQPPTVGTMKNIVCTAEVVESNSTLFVMLMSPFVTMARSLANRITALLMLRLHAGVIRTTYFWASGTFSMNDSAAVQSL